MTNAEKALERVSDGMTLGLGSGHAAERFVAALGDRVRAGLKVRGVPTSRKTADLAARAGIPLVKLDDALPIDITFDGADEVDPHLDLIKGYGHALFREKIVAAGSKQLVILIGPEHAREKLVGTLGERGKLPVEVVPFALPLVAQRLDDLGLTGNLLTDSAGPFVSDNGNHILELRVGPIPDPAALEQQLRAIPGVVATGLFLGMANAVLVEENGAVEVRQRASRG
ncbi:MAG TPA: ribose-5-phosphate isomerase RpiA [Gemmataceae bacterium]|nr:ribose-5-phosphate isomerase RpiA [Gemmataceae bacterium]